MSVGALVAVAHDILISVGLYSLFQFEVTPATVIAFLTIMGYSLYDTIVVYDKVREIGRRLGPTERYTYTEMMNLALNQVLMRSINTSITSVLPVLSMLVVGSFFLGALTLPRVCAGAADRHHRGLVFVYLCGFVACGDDERARGAPCCACPQGAAAVWPERRHAHGRRR